MMSTTMNGHAPAARTLTPAHYAQKLHAMGVNVLPIGSNKKPTVDEWAHWKTQPMASDEVPAFKPTDRIGVITGWQNWRNIDLDARENADGSKTPIPNEVLTHALAALGLPADYAWAGRSASGAGFHIWVRCADLPLADLPPRNEDKKSTLWGNLTPHPDVAAWVHHVELRAAGCYTMLPRPYGYMHQTTDAPPHEVTTAQLLAGVRAVASFDGPRPQAPALPVPRSGPQDGTWARIEERWDTVDYFVAQLGSATQPEPRGETRILGQHGLLVKEDRRGWYIHGEEVGGGIAAAITWVAHHVAKNWKDLTSRERHEVTVEAARFVGVTLEDGTPPRARRSDAAAPDADDADARGPKTTQAQQLIALARGACTFFKDADDGTAYARVPVNGHTEILSVARGGGFATWLRHQYYGMHEKPPSNDGLAGALDTLHAIATFDGESLPTCVRFGGDTQQLVIDLGDDTWRAVVIDATGWWIVDAPPVAMRRPRKGMLPLPEPMRHAPPLADTLRPLLNVRRDSDLMLLIGWLVGCLMPPGPGARAHLALFGEQGSAKSSATRLLRALVDPHAAAVRSAPKDISDLMIAAKNAAILALDNVSHIPPWLSDTLCQLSTGAAMATRELYTNGDEYLFKAKIPVVMNGITEFITRGDLLDRTLCVQLTPIAPDARLCEADLEAAIAAAHPAIFGALCDAASMALRNLAQTRLSRAPRLADFARWVEAAAPALGWQPGAFVDTYHAMQRTASAEAIEGDSVTMAIRDLVDAAGGNWQDTPAALHAAIETQIPVATRPKDFPKNAQALSRQIRRIASELRKIGMTFADDRTGNKRFWTFTTTPPEESGEYSVIASFASHTPPRAHQDAIGNGDAMCDGIPERVTQLAGAHPIASQIASHHDTASGRDKNVVNDASDGMTQSFRQSSDAGDDDLFSDDTLPELLIALAVAAHHRGEDHFTAWCAREGRTPADVKRDIAPHLTNGAHDPAVLMMVDAY